MNVAPARVLKILIAAIDRYRLAVTLAPADRELNLKPVRPAPAAAAVVDASVRTHASVFVNGGRRGLELSPDDLIRALEAKVPAIAR
jgi:prolyl-tRNA editing enzyme YbaK/EbsC (Cys-tRNA(Pro) deacylase)